MGRLEVFRKVLYLVAMISAAIAAEDSTAIPSEGLVAYYPFNGTFENNAGTEIATAENHGATFAADRFGNENSCVAFDGNGAYLEIPDNDVFSISTTGALTVSVWVSPEVLNFQNAEAGGYVHWMGKGEPHQHEWVFRMYNKDLVQGQENRPNRMSAYAFNLEGGLGSGSYVQEEIQEKEWIHFVARYDIESNRITLFKNGIQKDQDDLYDKTYGVQVQNGTAPLRLGTRSKWSYFQGCIDDLRIYSRALSENEILALYNEPAPKNNTEIENPEEQSSSSSELDNHKEKETLSSNSSEVVNQEESQAIRKNPNTINRSKVNFRSKKFFDLKGRLVREE